ncbi:MAG: hypothetical protein WBQ17_03425 [Rhizomicrobium sp.]|jgi:hypothetical protein
MGNANSIGANRNAGLKSMAMALVLVGCGAVGLFLHQTEIQSSNFRSYEALQTAYEAISPARTRVSDLGKLGFDITTSPNVESVSYLGVIERFMPRNSTAFDALDPAVKSCIDARAACSAYVFKPQRLDAERGGNWFFEMLGFESAHAGTGWSPEVLLLIQDGRVAYKIMSGRPGVHGYRDVIPPLGSRQDLGAPLHPMRAASL